MKKEKSRNLGPPDPFFHGEIAIWKKGGLIQPPPALIGLKKTVMSLAYVNKWVQELNPNLPTKKQKV